MWQILRQAVKYITLSIYLYSAIILAKDVFYRFNCPTELLPYRVKFEYLTGYSTTGIKYMFVEKGNFKYKAYTEYPELLIGLYTPHEYLIEISKEYWNSATIKEREILFYHETLHAMGFGHYDEKNNSDGCPLTIMSTEEYRGCSEKNYDALIQSVVFYGKVGTQ